MSRHRHKHKAMGGGVKPVWNAGGEQNAAKEAEEKKHGGKVHHMHAEGHEGKHHHHPKRAKGGAVALATGGPVSARARGGMVPGRKRGGGVGADQHPMSSASKIKEVIHGEVGEDSAKSG